MSFITIIALFTLASFIIGGLLGYAAEKLKVEGNPIVDDLERILPQTQCGQCGYVGCRQYAEAIATGKAAINLCIPGGQKTSNELAQMLNLPTIKMDTEEEEQIAFITENLCIGCHKCATNCPVDAIVGSGKMIHNVLTSRCTGCKLCTSTCPTKCITMKPKQTSPNEWNYKYPSIEEQRNIATQRGIIR